MLEREEYIEQAYFFRTLGERMEQNLPVQELLDSVKEEILSTARLPMAIDFLASEMRLTGGFSTAMSQMPHYFTSFQSYVVGEAENPRGRFDYRVAMQILEREAEYRAEGATRQGAFIYQFETLARNRLGYDKGLEAISRDPIYDDNWQDWILIVRRQVGLVDFADLIYVRSQHYHNVRQRQGLDLDGPERPLLFGEKEGKIAFANRGRDPLLLFSALQRHLNYPAVPRPKAVNESRDLLPLLLRRVERLEARLKLVEEEQRGGIDLSRFMGPAAQEPSDE